MSLRRVELSGARDFAALSAAHKAAAIEKLARGALDGALEEVRLDGLGLDLACAEALASLRSKLDGLEGTTSTFRANDADEKKEEDAANWGLHVKGRERRIRLPTDAAIRDDLDERGGDWPTEATEATEATTTAANANANANANATTAKDDRG